MNRTTLILIGVTALMIGYDIWAALNKETGDTITEVVRFGSQHPIIPFALGVLCGHLFWNI